MSIGIFDTGGNNWLITCAPPPLQFPSPPLNLALDRAANKGRAILTISQHSGDVG